MEFADWAWRAILIWFALLAALDILLKLVVKKRASKKEEKENNE